MHIPDGFLSTPVWLTLDVAALPAVAWLGRRAREETDESKAPLLGVMGAFVFAAQMVNFPVGVGTSGHLVGSALLTYTVGPASAAVVMTAILALQALVFQDGGLLALGPNVVNMAFAGVAAAWLPYYLWGKKLRRTAVFVGGFLSILVAACLALSELLLSGVRMPAEIVGASLGLFVIAGLIEGAITLAVLEALDRMNPGWVRAPAKQARVALGGLVMAALLIISAGVLFASALPDGLEHFAEEIGIAEQARTLFETPFADYEAAFVDSPWLRQVAAGVAGLFLIAAACLLLARMFTRKKEAS